MARFQIQGPDGLYELEAPNEQAAMAVIQQSFGAPQQSSIKAVAGPEPDNTPLQDKDWNALAKRINDAEAQSVGPLRPQDREVVRQMEARRQGDLYGNAQGKDKNLEVGLKSAANTFGLSTPQAFEAKFMQDALPYAEAHEFIKAQDAAKARNNPTGAMAGTVAGALAQGLILPVGGAASAAARIGQAGVMGAGLAGAESAIRNRADMGEVVSDMGKGAAFGAAGGVAGEAIANAIGGATRFAKNSSVLRSAPTRDELKAAEKAAYAAADLPNTTVTQPAMQRLATEVRSNLAAANADPLIAPTAARVADRVTEQATSPQALQQVENLRKLSGRIGNKLVAPEDLRGGQNIVNSIDDFYSRLTPADVIGRDPQASVAKLLEARAASAAGKRSDTITTAVEKAERQASKGGSGANLDNAIRQRIASLLDNPNKTRGFSEAEKQQMQRIVEGGSLQNLLRLLGKFDATGVVSTGVGGGALYGAGKAAGLEDKEALALAGTGILGAKGARYGAEALGRRNVDVLDAMIRARGAGQTVANPNQLPNIAEQLRKLIAATSAASYPAYASGKP